MISYALLSESEQLGQLLMLMLGWLLVTKWRASRYPKESEQSSLRYMTLSVFSVYLGRGFFILALVARMLKRR
ncbi:uncharacterized protein F4812DRAFT_420862 [Daldinia caldariorum]|uniref:uncharacterized protein n=1 Tax=Daldinia caldariorum TaxID=326644 RepID=UPI0020072882|nr:uncharacterized protein F4812DRAFT_420862 [Daldinia caldariorum]KAI1469922.1 hypothetical protein F4812DRAFT_420862 [Daldinia caldariorum]